MQVFTCILCTLLVFLVSGCWFFGGFILNFWKSMCIPFEVLLSIPVTEHNSGKEHFEMLKVAGRVGGGTPWAHCYAFKLVIMSIGEDKVCGPGQCTSMRRRYPWQPCERPPPGTVTLNNSVEYLPTNTYLALTLRGREGSGKTKAQNGMQTTSYCNNTLWRTEANNFVYKSQGAPARGIGPPPE